MDIDAYLQRIGYDGPTTVGLETLRGVQRAHALAIPYETFDIFFGRPISTDPAAAFAKIVGEGRGGWCYEHNGLLGLALEALGFKVTRLTAHGDQPATHLTLRVDIPDAGAFVCDPGYSDAPLDPFALKDGEFQQNGFVYRVETLGQDGFRFINHRLGLVPGFTAGPADEAAMSAASDWLQSSPESRFIHVPVVCIHEANGFVRVLAGRTFRTIRPDRVDNVQAQSVGEYKQLLRDTFKLDVAEAADLWPEIVARQDEFDRRKKEADAARP